MNARDDLVCDFCNEPNPRWEYPAGDIELVPGLEGSLGPWTACDFCKLFIDGDDREALARRHNQRNPSHPIPVVRLMQDKFFAAKSGEARLIKVTPMHGRRFLQ